MPSSAFATKAAHRTEGRLILRRLRRLTPTAAAAGPGELFAPDRDPAVFTDTPLPAAPDRV